MYCEISHLHGICCTLTAPEEEFHQLFYATRKTHVFLSPALPGLVLKKNLFFTTSSIPVVNELDYPKLRKHKSQEYIEKELLKESISRHFLAETDLISIPPEKYFIAKSPDSFEAPYRIQTLQEGMSFNKLPLEFWQQPPDYLVQILHNLINADINCFNEHGYHLDLIGFACDHLPTLDEIALVYKNPFPHATNLILRPNGSVSWVDAKTSNLTPEINQMRTTLYLEWLSKF